MHSSHVVRSGDIRLHARMTQPADHSARERPAIVLVHGYPDDSSVWDGVRDTLAHERRVLTFDVRGAGLSDAPANTTGYRIPQFVDDLAAVADALLPGERFHLVGHDWGSIHSWESVTTDRVRGRRWCPNGRGDCGWHVPGRGGCARRKAFASKRSGRRLCAMLATACECIAQIFVSASPAPGHVRRMPPCS